MASAIEATASAARPLVVVFSSMVYISTRVNRTAEQFGEVLRRARGERSLQEISESAKISTAYLHKLEAGRVGNPSPRVLERLAGVLDVPYWTLMDLVGYLPANEPKPRHRRQKETPVNRIPREHAPTNARIVALLAEIADRLARLEEQQGTLLRQLNNAETHR